jgi:uncharacterized lipoprotein YddW (UPF0748 family)
MAAEEFMNHFLLFFAVVATAGLPSAASESDPPPAPREFRAAWVATVGNIDWPSKPGLPASQQQEEARTILDRCLALRLNAVVLQVRPACDAIYPSSLEPWSYYLTGKQGQAPEPAYDPLKFWIEEAHARGLHLHAWFNPFRARISGAQYELHSSHVGHAHPDWVRSYGNSLWLDPGNAEAGKHTLTVIAEVVRCHDVDGVHLDDYFYPYPVKDSAGKELDFPDEPVWTKYRAGGGKLERADWRRQNVNLLIEQLYQTVRREKPNVLVGISPFGIPRPGVPKGVVGFDQYAKLYADATFWLRSGWCDYWTPQLYWKVNAPGQPYRPLLEYWVHENVKTRHVWPGLSVSRVGEGPNQYAPEEILQQIAITRQTPAASGNVLFSMKALLADRRGLAGRLAEGPYREPALVPATPWLKGPTPGRPGAAVRDGNLDLVPGPDGETFVWAVWMRSGKVWDFRVVPAQRRRIPLPSADRGIEEVVVTAVSRMGVESPRVRAKKEGQPSGTADQRKTPAAKAND